MLDAHTLAEPLSLHWAIRNIPAHEHASPAPSRIVSLLAAGFDVNRPYLSSERPPYPIEKGDSPLHVAAAVVRPNVIRFLANNGANISATNSMRETALHRLVLLTYSEDNFARPGDQAIEDAAAALVEAGIDLSAKDGKNRTALQYVEENEAHHRRKVDLRMKSDPAFAKSYRPKKDGELLHFDRMAALLGRKPTGFLARLFGP